VNILRIKGKSVFSKWINPQETATVRITLTTRPGFYQDLITFSVVGSETVTKNVLVDVGSTKEDRHDPYLDYHFTSDCTSVLFGACEDATWTVEVQAKDTGSGKQPRIFHVIISGLTTIKVETMTHAKHVLQYYRHQGYLTMNQNVKLLKHVELKGIQGDSEISLEKKCGVSLTPNNSA
jgi:hypothetical protein